MFNNFVGAVQALVDLAGFERRALCACSPPGQTLAQHLNGMTADIQGLRSDAELGLSDAVNQANDAMRQIAAINRQLGLTNVAGRDDRDAAATSATSTSTSSRS